MELITSGIEFFCEYKMPFWFNQTETFESNLGLDERFRLILIEEGNGLLRLNEHLLILQSPCLICLNEQECPELINSVNVKARGIYFHPRLINKKYTFENIRDKSLLETITIGQDRKIIRAFINRNDQYFGQLILSLNSARRITQLFNTIDQEVNYQTKSWPCRTKSFFYELLILTDRLYYEPEEEITTPLTDNTEDINPVILYLHLNYKQKITIRELTITFNMNRTTLSRRFLEATGESIMSYLLKIRINLAAKLLRDTKLSISQILERVGFIDDTHFGRAFKKHFNISPSEYREIHNNPNFPKNK